MLSNVDELTVDRLQLIASALRWSSRVNWTGPVFR